MSDRPPVIELKGVKKSFPGNGRHAAPVQAVENVDLVIPDEEGGEFVAFLGPSGCGKSTLLNLISGMFPVDSGEIRVFGELVSGPDPKSVTVPQAYTCFPWLTAIGNVEFGLMIQGQSRADRSRVAAEYLEKVGLADRHHAYPRELSGGMQQRVAIARTLAMKPPIMLMDEPFGALDAQIRADMQQMLIRLWEEERNTVVFVTHDISEALLLADRVVVFSPRPARIVQEVPVPFTRPRSSTLPFDSEFIKLNQALLHLLKHPPESPG